jgi:hypothetical protein
MRPPKIVPDTGLLADQVLERKCGAYLWLQHDIAPEQGDQRPCQCSFARAWRSIVIMVCSLAPAFREKLHHGVTVLSDVNVIVSQYRLPAKDCMTFTDARVVNGSSKHLHVCHLAACESLLRSPDGPHFVDVFSKSLLWAAIAQILPPTIACLALLSSKNVELVNTMDVLLEYCVNKQLWRNLG